MLVVTFAIVVPYSFTLNRTIVDPFFCSKSNMKCALGTLLVVLPAAVRASVVTSNGAISVK